MKNVYGLAGVVAALLLAPLSWGQVVYSGLFNQSIARTDYRVDSLSTYPDPRALNLDFTGDGIADFSLFTVQPIPSSPSFVLFEARGLNGSYYEGRSSIVLDNFAAGAVLGAGPQWSSDIDWPTFPLSPPAQNWWQGGHWHGNIGASFDEVFYLGLKLKMSDGFHFAWVGLSLPATGFTAPLILRDWAYEATAGTSIVTGDIGLAASPVPEPGTYGAIATLGLGLLMVARYRKKVEIR